MKFATVKKWFPTNKWWVATVIACGTIVELAWLGNGIDTDAEKGVVVGLVVQRIASYWAKNEDPVVVEVQNPVVVEQGKVEA
jgi:hypothetical protein